MGKIKIHEIAKELGLTSKQIIEKANSLGIEVSSHMSSVDEEQAKSIKDSFGVAENKSAKEVASEKAGKKEKLSKESKGKADKDTVKNDKTDKNKKVKDEKKNETPVIIRREVIINDEPKKVEEKPKNNRSDVGFVERNKNQDYNIVYRNKTTKPMTFSELFGIKDNKKEKAESKKENLQSAEIKNASEENKKVEEAKKAQNITSKQNEESSKKIDDQNLKSVQNVEIKEENKVEIQGKVTEKKRS